MSVYACAEKVRSEHKNNGIKAQKDSLNHIKESEKEGKPLPPPSGNPNEDKDFDDYSHS